MVPYISHDCRPTPILFEKILHTFDVCGTHGNVYYLKINLVRTALRSCALCHGHYMTSYYHDIQLLENEQATTNPPSYQLTFAGLQLRLNQKFSAICPVFNTHPFDVLRRFHLFFIFSKILFIKLKTDKILQILTSISKIQFNLNIFFTETTFVNKTLF